MVRVARIITSLLRIPVRKYKSSTVHLSTIQKDQNTKEKQTHFGFEQINESEKQRKGNDV